MNDKLSIPYPTIGIDIDGTITENTLFFSLLSRFWPGKVIIVTYRESREGAESDLKDFCIEYDELVMTEKMDKSSIIKEKGIEVYFDDQDEMIKNIPEEVTVVKMRNGGNFDFSIKKWIYGDDTGIDINEYQAVWKSKLGM